MKTLHIAISIVLFTTVFTAAASAQKTSTRRTKPLPKPTVVRNTTLPPLDVRAARVKVSNQVSNVDRFITVLGPIAQSIEALDNESRTRKISKTSLDTNQQNKQKLLAAIRNMRAGIDALETEFETKPVLKVYLIKIQGVSDLAAQSENLAFSGKYVASRDPWRTILQKLNDTMRAMPNAEL